MNYIKKYKIKARNQRIGHNFAVRGDIYDRNGIKLATDNVFYNVFARRVDYDNDASSPEAIATALAPILKMSKGQLLKKLNSARIAEGRSRALPAPVSRTVSRLPGRPGSNHRSSPWGLTGPRRSGTGLMAAVPGGKAR